MSKHLSLLVLALATILEAQPSPWDEPTKTTDGYPGRDHMKWISQYTQMPNGGPQGELLKRYHT
jgi:hypothetical protein